MIIKPELLVHPKYIHLKAEVGAMATEYLVQLWGHCEKGNRGEFWPGAGADYVEVVCTGKKQGGKLYKQLASCGWLRAVPGGTVIVGWDDANKSLVAAWRRWYKYPAQQAINEATQQATHQATDILTQSRERSREEKNEAEMKGDGTPPTNKPLSLEQAQTHFTPLGFDLDQILIVFNSFESTKSDAGAWTWGKGFVRDWKAQMQIRLQDRVKKTPNAKNATAKLPSDVADWWDGPVADLKASWAGALALKNAELAERLGAIYRLRTNPE